MKYIANPVVIAVVSEPAISVLTPSLISLISEDALEVVEQDRVPATGWILFIFLQAALGELQQHKCQN